MHRYRPGLVAGIVASAVLIAAPAQAQTAEPYPNRPIRLLIGYTPAGAADFIARIVADGLGRELGQAVTVENKPGAGSTLASTLLAQAPADGYTLGLATGTLYGIDQHLYKVRYTPADFTPITRFTIAPLILAVNKDAGIATVAELADRIRANPGKLNYSSSGIGGSPHIAGVSFEKAIGGSMQHVPYKGGAPALQAVAANEVQLSFGTAASVLPMGRQGLVRMLGVTTADPSRVAPELPTLASAGLPGFDISFWFGLFGPANLPKAVEERLFAAATRVLAQPEIRDKLIQSGNDPAPSSSPAEFDAWATRSGAFVLERVRQANIKVE